MADVVPVFGGLLGLVVGIFLLVLAILWFILPFAIFGIKPKLDMILTDLNKTNKLLASYGSVSKVSLGSIEIDEEK